MANSMVMHMVVPRSTVDQASSMARPLLATASQVMAVNTRTTLPRAKAMEAHPGTASKPDTGDHHTALLRLASTANTHKVGRATISTARDTTSTHHPHTRAEVVHPSRDGSRCQVFCPFPRLQIKASDSVGA